MPNPNRAGREDDHVVHVLTRQVRGEGRALGQGDIAGDVLHAVHRDVDLAQEQVPVDLLQERTLAAQLGQVTLPAVAGGLDAGKLDPDILDALEEQLTDMLGLGHGHR